MKWKYQAKKFFMLPVMKIGIKFTSRVDDATNAFSTIVYSQTARKEILLAIYQIVNFRILGKWLNTIAS